MCLVKYVSPQDIKYGRWELTKNHEALILPQINKCNEPLFADPLASSIISTLSATTGFTSFVTDFALHGHDVNCLILVVTTIAVLHFYSTAQHDNANTMSVHPTYLR